MSFIIRKTKHRAWPVSVRQAECGADGVVSETTASFVAHFAPFTEAQLESARKAAEALYPLPEGAAADALPSIALVLARAAALYAEVIVGWGPEVQDEAGASIPFSQGKLREMVTGPDGYAIMLGIAAALGDLRFGVAPAKNSNALAGPGAMPAAAEAAPTN